MLSIEEELTYKQCRACICSSLCSRSSVVLISYVRPASDSDAEETKDTSRAMAPPPLPLAKKVRYWFGLSLLRTIAYLFRFRVPRVGHR